MAKKVAGVVKLQIKAQEAAPNPPVGPALGQRGVNIMEFCKAFNAYTKDIEKGMPTPVEITVYSDRSFTFITKSPPASVLIKKELKLTSGSKLPGKDKAGVITIEQIKKIVDIKKNDLTANDMAAAIRTIAGTARSMGIDVEGIEDV